MNALIGNKPTCFVLTLALAFCTAAPPALAGDFYQQRNLVADQSNVSDNNDPHLVNAWGLAFNPFGPVWVAANGTGLSTLYDGTGKPQSLVVQIPAPASASSHGAPTGIVFNGSAGFVVASGGVSGPSRFIFATEDGVIAGWAPAVDSTHAIRAVDNSAAGGAVYKGLALGAGGNGALLYATDFHNNKIDVFDQAFKPVPQKPGAFSDGALPLGFAPFGIQVINGDLYVSYAKQDATKHDDVKGKGLGFLNVFDTNGHLIRRLVSRGGLNAPWGMSLAPAGFGRFGNRLLVGNFGDGLINAYDLATGQFVGRLRTSDRHPVRIDGLWGLAFGNGFSGQPVDTLYFAAGPGDEQHGRYGRIDPVPGNARDDLPGEESGDN